jgi:hypothetical protein
MGATATTDPTALARAIHDRLAAADKRWGDISEKLAPLLEDSKANKAEIKEIASDLKEVQGEHKTLRAALVGIERKHGRRPLAKAGVVDSPYRGPIHLGRAFVQSDAYKEWLDQGGAKTGPKHSRRVELDASPWGAFDGMDPEHKTMVLERDGRTPPTDLPVLAPKAFKSVLALTSESGSLGALVNPWDRPDVLELRRRIPIVRELLTVLPIPATNAVDFDRELAEFFLATCVVTAVGSGGATSLDVESARGFHTTDPGGRGFNKIKIVTSSGTEEVTLSSVDPDASPNTITFAPALVGTVALNALVTADFFEFTAEATLKPRGLDQFEQVQAPVETLATWVEASNQILDDAVRLEDRITRRLLSRLARMEEQAIFYGPGTTGQIKGFFVETLIPQVLWSAQAVGTSKLDLLLIAMTVVTLAEYLPEAVLLSPSDMRDIMLTKGDDGHFVFFQVQVQGFPTRIWMAEIRMTTALEPKDALTGEFSTGATLYDRQSAAIRIGEPNDFFLRNVKAILAEERIAFSIDFPIAFARIKFDSAPTP